MQWFCLQKRGDICNCNRPPSSQYISVLFSSSYLRLEQARDSWRKYFISTIWKLRWFQTSMRVRRILKKFPFICHFFMILFLFWSGVLESSSSSEESSVARDSTLGGAFCYSPFGCVLCSRDYDVFEKEYMFKSCTICLL